VPNKLGMLSLMVQS